MKMQERRKSCVSLLEYLLASDDYAVLVVPGLEEK